MDLLSVIPSYRADFTAPTSRADSTAPGRPGWRRLRADSTAYKSAGDKSTDKSTADKSTAYKSTAYKSAGDKSTAYKSTDKSTAEPGAYALSALVLISFSRRRAEGGRGRGEGFLDGRGLLEPSGASRKAS